MDPRILIIDDDLDLADLVREFLEGEGFAVSVEPEMTHQAIQSTVRRLEPACILLDGRSPLEYGESWDEAAWIAGRQRPIPVIMFTASRADIEEAREGESDRSRRAGIFATVEKPFDLDHLLHIVREAVVQPQRPPGVSPVGADQGQLLATLEQLIALPASDLTEALNQSAQLLAEVFRAEKVDAWLPHAETNEIIAVGVSDTPLGRKQVALGLDRFSLNTQSTPVHIFTTGEEYLTGRADQDPLVYPPVHQELGVRSMIGVPFTVTGERSGVLLIASTHEDRFTDNDLRFLETVARWVGTVAQRGELMQQRAERDAERRAREEAEAERERLHRLFQQSPAAVAMLTGPEHVFTLANPFFLRIIDRSDVLGQPVRRVLPEVEGQGYFDLLDRVRTSGQAISQRERQVLLRRGGATATAYFDFVYQPVLDINGSVEGIFIHAVEVTDQVEARQRSEALAAELADQRDRLELAQEAGNIGSFDWDFETGRVTWTAELEAIYGLPPGGFGGTYEAWLPFVHPDDSERVTSEVRVAIEGSLDFDSQYRIIRPDDTIRHVAAYGRFIRDIHGNLLRMVGVNVDITERVDALDAAREAIRARDEFLSIASHELRTPLAGIVGMAQMLSRQLDRDQVNLGRLRRNAAIVQTSADRLARLVDDLLDVSRLRTGQLRMQLVDTDLNALIREALERVEIVHPDHPIVLDESCTTEPCTISADPDRLGQVISNLLENAIKYSPEGGEIDVALRHEQDGVLLRITDQGIGFGPEVAERIFEPFGRAENATARRIPGMGLGLFVSRQIVDSHGGRLLAESPGEGHGATFTLWLPSPEAVDEPDVVTEQAT